MNNSSSEAFFYQQKSLRERPKRCRKLPEELPESLKFAHLNPKVAALLANKERQQKQEELNNLANLEKHGVDIGNTFQHLKNQFDSVFLQDEDSQRYLFEEAKGSSCNILEQLSQLLWIFKDVLSPNLIPKSLEYQLMMSYKELTSDVIYLQRDWQTVAIREQFLKSSEVGSEDGHKNVVVDNEALHQEQSVVTEHIPAKKHGHKTKVALPGNESDDVEVKHEKTTRHSDSKTSIMTSRHKHRNERTGSATKKSPAPKRNIRSCHGPESPQEMRGGLPHLNTSVIHFELSSKLCEDKGWIMNKGDEMQIEREQVLEWCIQILKKSLKTITTQKEKDVGLDKPVQVRYYGDTRHYTMNKYRRSPVKLEVNPAIHGGSPHIPKINDDKYEGKHLMLSGHSDGTSIVYYPSGRPAIVYSSASHGHPGFYTLVYDDDDNMKMLGCFPPTGTSCVYHDNGTIWFLATSIGGHLADKDGHATKKWKWPTGNVKIPSQINLQLNKAIHFRCAAFSQMSIVYNYEKESAKFLVSASAETLEPNPEESDQLLTTFNFTSNAAKELLRLSYSKLKMKKKKDKVNGEIDSDIPKMLEITEITMYGTDAEKDYAKLLRKGKGLIEDWMETYRTAFGLSSPCLNSITDGPTSRKRYSQSAKPSRFDTESRGVTLGIGNKQPYGSSRIPSAPAGHTRKTSMLSAKAGAGSVKFDDDTVRDSHGCGDGRKMSLSLTSLSAAVTDVTKLLSLSISPRSRIHSARSKSSVKEPIDEATVISTCETCPVVLCQRLMGMAHVNCRCSRYIIPNITDIEFDLFISKVVPNAQLQVIIVVSSLFPKRNEVFELLEKMYTKQNRNRMKPCQQCFCDTFRLLKYDINTAAENSDHTQPLLLTRHNAVPGMILIYSDGNLLFCDNIFNGYGNTKKDFKKQITKSRLDAVHGVFLPKDFRFKPSQGHHGPRSAWGGEIGGAGVDSYGSPGTSKDDIILHRPSSSSTFDGQVPDKLKGLDASNFICFSLSPMGYRPKSQVVRTRHKLPTAVK